MKLRTNWHASWTPWKTYATRPDTGEVFAPRMQYQSRSRQLYVGKLLLATLVQSTKVPKAPFYMYVAGNPRLTVYGTSAFRTVRRFMRQLRS